MQTDLRALYSEYSNLDCLQQRDAAAEVDWDQLSKDLVAAADWTPLAAATLTTLVRTYGAFMLRNACALAICCEREDGDCGL